MVLDFIPHRLDNLLPPLDGFSLEYLYLKGNFEFTRTFSAEPPQTRAYVTLVMLFRLLYIYADAPDIPINDFFWKDVAGDWQGIVPCVPELIEELVERLIQARKRFLVSKQLSGGPPESSLLARLVDFWDKFISSQPEPREKYGGPAALRETRRTLWIDACQKLAPLMLDETRPLADCSITAIIAATFIGERPGPRAANWDGHHNNTGEENSDGFVIYKASPYLCPGTKFKLHVLTEKPSTRNTAGTKRKEYHESPGRRSPSPATKRRQSYARPVNIRRPLSVDPDVREILDFYEATFRMFSKDMRDWAELLALDCERTEEDRGCLIPLEAFRKMFSQYSNTIACHTIKRVEMRRAAQKQEQEDAHQVAASSAWHQQQQQQQPNYAQPMQMPSVWPQPQIGWTQTYNGGAFSAGNWMPQYGGAMTAQPFYASQSGFQQFHPQQTQYHGTYSTAMPAAAPPFPNSLPAEEEEEEVDLYSADG